MGKLHLINIGNIKKNDLLITDVVMPVMSGKELIDKLRIDYLALKVLLISGYTDDALEHHSDHDSDIDFVQEPYILIELVEQIKGILETRKLPGENYSV